MAYLSSSEDEFPPVEVVIQRQRHKLSITAELDGDKENAPTRPSSPSNTTYTSFGDSIGIGKTPATARRRRRLGQGQPVANSLRKPWNDLNPALETGSKTASRDSSMMTTSTFASDILDRLPAKAKRADSRLVSGATMFDSPPQERKKTQTRRLISGAEKRAQELKVVESERDWLVSDDEESEINSKSRVKNLFPSRTKNDDSEFLLGKFQNMGISDSDDSDDPCGEVPERSQSPSRPRRLQRRILSSSNDPTKNFTQSKTIPDDPERRSPKKRPSKQPIVAEPAKPEDESSLEDVLNKLRIFDDFEPENKESGGRDKAPVLEPVTPGKTLSKPTLKVPIIKLSKPALKEPIIPLSPWKPEHKEFWDPEVNFKWIDKHSPPKKNKSATAATIDLTAPEAREEMKRRYGTSPEKKQAKKSFDAVKEELARTFLLELDEVVTGGRLGELTESTGGLTINWSNTLLTTAGRAHWKCKTTTTTTTNKQCSDSASTSVSAPVSAAPAKTTTETKQHYASIELATKVLSNESDLLNTVAHEFCHLAVFLLHGKPKLAHGPEFKSYGQQVSKAAAAAAAAKSTSTSTSASSMRWLKTPRSRGVEIEVTTRHSYEIEYRYVWRCVECATEVKRHSRSVNPERQVCGKCHGGRLVQVKPVPRGAGAAGIASTATAAAKNNNNKVSESILDGGRNGDGKRGAAGTGGTKKETTIKKRSAYQEFTSQEMKALSLSHKGLSFKEKMGLVSTRWAEHQRVLKQQAAADADAGAGTTTLPSDTTMVGEGEGEGAATKVDVITKVDTKDVNVVTVETLVEAVEVLDIED